MAQVASAIEERVEFLLNDLTEAWQALPKVEQEIDTWDLVEQIDYVEEWGPKEALLRELGRLMGSPFVSQRQRERYAELQRLVRQHRPILKALRES